TGLWPLRRSSRRGSLDPGCHLARAVATLGRAAAGARAGSPRRLARGHRARRRLLAAWRAPAGERAAWRAAGRDRPSPRPRLAHRVRRRRRCGWRRRGMSTGAERQRRYRQRQRSGAEPIVVDLRPEVLFAMIDERLIGESEATDRKKIGAALE